MCHDALPGAFQKLPMRVVLTVLLFISAVIASGHMVPHVAALYRYSAMLLSGLSIALLFFFQMGRIALFVKEHRGVLLLAICVAIFFSGGVTP